MVLRILFVILITISTQTSADITGKVINNVGLYRAISMCINNGGLKTITLFGNNIGFIQCNNDRLFKLTRKLRFKRMKSA